jgi:hypothetical protein
MEPVKTVVKSGKYTFQITDNTFLYEGEIYSRSFKIGERQLNCIDISISYKDGKPTAHIPYVEYNPGCSIDTPLDSGRGTIVMIKTLLNYIHSQMPIITEVTFEDKSNIECATDLEITKKCSRFRKQGSHIYPIPLYYFSIAFNGETWYEKHFNARQKDHKKHSEYKMKINSLLNEPETKSAISFLQFLQMTAPPMEIAKELSGYYERTDTFGRFFQSIPKTDRCRLVRDWIGTFMYSKLKGVFDNKDWVIDIPSLITGGGRRSTKKRYYCPKCRVYRNTTYRDYGLNAIDI